MTRPPILTYRQAKSYSSQAPRKSRPEFRKHPIPSKDLPSRVQRLTDRFRLVAGRSFHRLSRRWQRSLQILCVHVQLLLRASRNGGGCSCGVLLRWKVGQYLFASPRLRLSRISPKDEQRPLIARFYYNYILSPAHKRRGHGVDSERLLACSPDALHP